MFSEMLPPPSYNDVIKMRGIELNDVNRDSPGINPIQSEVIE